MAAEVRLTREGPAGRWRRRLAALNSALCRHFGFDTRRGVVNATVAVALVCALISLLRGQDANWDLRNYHVHNAWSLMQGRLGIDLAPAQMQSYFVPFLDLPYYLLVRHAPAPLAGLLLGLWHGLAFLPVALIARRALDGDSRRDWLAPLLALAGLASAAFLSELGNTMGNNGTAPLLLGAFALALPGEDGRWRLARLVPAGALLGAAVALKLTNAIYALALGTAVLAVPLPWRARMRAFAWLAGVALVVAVLLAGFWYWRLWETFGNPLFPQFNAWFQAPLAQPVSVADQRWLPNSTGEALLRPLLFTLDPLKISEIPLWQIHWALLYLGAIAAVVAWLFRSLRGRGQPAQAALAMPVQRMLVVFFLVGFVLWQVMFSVHRYLVALELLSPLLLWLLAHWLFRGRLAPRAATLAIVACALVALVGWNGWGHAGWTRTAFRVEAPRAPPGAILLVGIEPQAWRIPFLPPATVYASVGSNFPESRAYRERVRQITGAHASVQAMLPAPLVTSGEAVARKIEANESRNRWAAWLFLDRGQCRVMKWAATRSKSRMLLDGERSPTGRCRFELLPGQIEAVADQLPSDANPSGANLQAGLLQQADAILERYRLKLVPDGCVAYESWIGSEADPYQLCPVVQR